MKRILQIIAMVAIAAVLAPAAWAGNDSQNGSIHHNTIEGGKGGNATATAVGQGGKGGVGIGVGGSVKNSGNSHVNVRNRNQNHNTNINAISTSTRQGQKQGQAQGQKQSANNEGITVEGDKVEAPRQAPPAFAPNLVAAPETCMGSTAIGASSPFGGVSFGQTYKSDDCELRMFARALQSLGQSQAALELLAQNPKVAAALKAAGVKVVSRPEEVKVVAASAATVSAAVAPPAEHFGD